MRHRLPDQRIRKMVPTKQVPSQTVRGFQTPGDACSPASTLSEIAGGGKGTAYQPHPALRATSRSRGGMLSSFRVNSED
jgi:hypothetical protein